MQIWTRWINESGFEALAELHTSRFNAPPWNDGWSTEAAAEHVTELVSHPSFIGMLGGVDSQVVALAMGYRERWVKGYQYHIKDLYVEPGHQARGVEKLLMNALLEKFHADVILQIHLETRSEARSQQFFTGLGFKRLPLTSMILRL